MNGLIVAGVASIVGIAGVAGLTLATADTAPAPPPAAVSTAAPDGLAQRLARLREAERAADAALRRADARAAGPAAAVPMSAVAPATSGEAHHGRDDGEHGGRGRDHAEDD
jgi:hypothetical protein